MPPNGNEESLPAYGERNPQVDPTAQPPRYSLDEAQNITPHFIHDAHLLGHPSSRFQDRDYGDGRGVIRHWQQEQESSRSSEDLPKTTEAIALDARRSRIKESINKPRRKGFVIIGFAILIFITILVPVVTARVKASKSDRDRFSYNDARQGTSVAASVVTFPSNSNPPISLYFYQSNGSSIQMTLEEQNIDGGHKIFAINDDPPANLTGIAHIIRDREASSMSTSLFYVNQSYMIRERTSLNGPEGWGTTTGRASTWESRSSPGQQPTYEVSHTDLTVGAGFDQLDIRYSNGTQRCSETDGTAWLFYRPRGNASLIQEAIYDGGSKLWSLGSTFAGAKERSQLVTFVTPNRGQDSSSTYTRWLYALGEDGSLQQWSCRDCCLNTTGRWQKRSQGFALPNALPGSLSLAGRVEGSSIAIYYRCEGKVVCKVQSNYPPASLAQPGSTELTPGFKRPMSLYLSGSPDAGDTAPSADSQLAVSEGDDLVQLDYLQQDSDGVISVLKQQQAGDFEKVPTGPLVPDDR